MPRARTVAAMFTMIVLALSGFTPYAMAQIPCSYEVAAIIQGPPGPIHQSPTFATAISPDGQHVVGYYRPDAVGDPRPWYWSQATGLVLLPLPPGFYSASPADINNSRVIVGTGLMPSIGSRGYMYDMASGAFTMFEPLPGGVWSFATGINEAGTVCGTRSIGSKTDPVNPTTAFRWSAADGFSDLGLINNKSTSAAAINSTGHVSISTGFSIDPGSLAYVWQPPMLVAVGPVPGGSTSGASDINDQGWLLTGGLIQQNPLVLAAFARSSTGQFVELPPLIGGSSAGVPAISANGVVAGHTNYQTPNFHRHACIWRDGQVVALASLVNEPFAGALESARISANEVIVANSTTNNGDLVAVVLSPVFGPPGDVTCDDSVNVSDLLKVIGSWGPCLGCDADVNRDSTVNVWDVIEVIVNWGTGGAL